MGVIVQRHGDVAWPMIYCNALEFIPTFAMQVQNVCRGEWGVMLDNGSLCYLLYSSQGF